MTYEARVSLRLDADTLRRVDVERRKMSKRLGVPLTRTQFMRLVIGTAVGGAVR